MRERADPARAADVADAMRVLAREGFLPAEQRARAHEDRPLPLWNGQTGSQPSTVAAMLRLLQVPVGARVLDVGSGSGWTTALLGRLVGPDGVVLRYRKVNSWIPIETFASPHLVEGYEEELFPVADTRLGRIACLTCYDALFPETYREVASRGAEIVLLANALPNPWQTESPTPWLTIVPQVRSLENAVITVNVNQGGDLAPFQFNGGSAVFDWEGRILAQTLQRGEQFVYARIDLAGLREWRRTTYQHLGPAHLRFGAYSYLSRLGVHGGTLAPDGTVTLGSQRRLIDEGRARWLGPQRESG